MPSIRLWPKEAKNLFTKYVLLVILSPVCSLFGDEDNDDSRMVGWGVGGTGDDNGHEH